jgi:hypothetical protein
MPTHPLEIQRLSHSTLGAIDAEPLHKGWPEIIHRR